MSAAAAHLGKNSLCLLAARIGAQVLALFSILLARKLGSAGFGEYAFFTAAIFIGNVLSTFGTDMFFIREIAARDDMRRLPAVLCIQLFLSGLLVGGIVLGAPFLPRQSLASISALQIYSLALFPLAFYGVFTIALRGRQLMSHYALLNLIGALLQAGVILLFVVVGDGVVTLAVLLLGAQILIALLAAWMCAAQIGGFWCDWYFSWGDVRAVAAASAPLGVLGLLGMFYQKLSLVLLSLLGGPALAGLYSAALRVADASKTVHIAVLTSLYPAMSQAQAQPSAQADGAIRLSWKLLLAWAFALALGLSLLAEPLVNLLYGAEFALAAPILRILAWTLVPYTVNSFLTLAFVASHRARALGWVLTASLLGLGLLSVWWMPAYGLAGCAWAVFSVECFQAALLLLHMPESQKLLRGKEHELSKLS